MTIINASFGTSLPGSLTNAATDTYQFTAAAAGMITLDFTHPSGPGTSTVPIVLTLMDLLGNVIATQTALGNTSFVATVAGAGTYFVKVADGNIYSYNDGGIYTLTTRFSSVNGVTYDGTTNNTTATALTSAMAAPIVGTLNVSDVDMFKVRADSGGILTLTLQHPNGAGSDGARINIDVLDAAGNVVTSKSLAGDGSFVTTVPAAGDYYLKIADGDPSNAQHGGTYTVTPTLSGTTGTTYDGAVNNTTSTALASAMGTPIVGGINAADIDMFKVRADSGGVLTLALLHPNGAGGDGVPIKIDVLDATGNVITSQSLSGDGSFVTTVAAAGDYYLKLADGNPGAAHGGTYTLTPTLSTKAGTTYDGAVNNTTATAMSSAMAVPIVGSLNISDIDVFKVHADSGGVLTLTLLHPNGAGSNGAPIKIDVVDEAGNVVVSESLSGNGGIVTTVPKAGDYYLKVADGNPDAGGHGGTYTLTPTLSTVAGATYDGATNNATATALSSAMGTPIIGSLNVGDVDMFKVHADGGGVLTLSLQHPNGIGSSGQPIKVDVIDTAGNLVTTQTLSGTGTIATTVNSAGDYYLKVYDGDQLGQHGGTYTLTPSFIHQPGVVYDGAASNATTTALDAPLSSTIMGSVYNGDTDYFKFTAGSGGALTLNFSHPNGIGSNGSPISIAILDSGGKSVFAKTEYGSDLITTTLAGGDDYYLKVSDGNPSATDDGGIYKIIVGLSGPGAINATGTAAVDKYESTAGNDVINGAGGLDTVTYHGNSGEYQINVSSVGAMVADSLGRDGTDTLINVERLQFADNMVALDVDGVAGQVYRLYQAAFDRVPDVAGVGFWIAQMEKGYTLTAIAKEFINSQEFQQRYGANASNHDLVTGFYANVLHRAPDQAGQDYWNNALDNHVVDAATVLASFSTSAENVAQLTGVLAHGITYTPLAVA